MLQKIGRVLGVGGGACGLIATAAVFLLPMYEGVSVTVTNKGDQLIAPTRKTLLEVQSLQPITVLFFSTIVFLSLVALFSSVGAGNENHRRYGIAITIAGALLLFLSFISGFSVGAFYLPGAVLVFIAGILLAL